MQKHVMIVENSTNSLAQNESNVKAKKFILEGIFTEFEVENRNKRIYTADNFLPCMNGLLEKKNKLGVVYGEYDHPDIFDVTGKNISHAIEGLTYNESANRVDGSISLLNTHYGKEARSIINDGYPLFVSSRAAGVTEGNGRVFLKELFTYDIVVDPGFASARVMPKMLNESMGYSSGEDVNFRIYEMNDAQIELLFKDNKNDIKTKKDIQNMEQYLKEQLLKFEEQILAKFGKTSPEEIKTILENYESVKEELNKVNSYLNEFKTKFNILVKENETLKTELNENLGYANHVATSVKALTKQTNDIQDMLEYVAEHAKANILFSEDIANNLTTTTEMLEYVAEHVKTNAQFLEYVAEETQITQKFVEHVAVETKDTQDFAEYVANEKYKDEVWLSYIAEKVDGIIDYNVKSIDKIKSSVAVNESNTDSIHNLESIVDYLGIEEERTIVNKIKEDFDSEESEDIMPEETDVNNNDAGLTPEIETPAETEEVTPEVTPEMNAGEGDDLNLGNELQTQLLNAIVKVIGTDDTGIVMEITPDNKLIIQKSGSDETMSIDNDPEGFEVIGSDDNVVEKVEIMLAEIKKQKAIANSTPHFFSFLSETQISDFNNLAIEDRENIIVRMNESEYVSSQDVLKIIGETLNSKTTSYEEEFVKSIPAVLKESWDGLTIDQKRTVVNESKYFPLVTSSDVTNFWNTRSFAKSVLSPEVTMVKESLNNSDEKLNETYVDSFIKSYNNLMK